MRRFWDPSRRLQWKLTLSYTLITIAAILLIEMLTFTAVLAYILFNQVALLENSVQAQATQAVPYFVHGTPDREALAKWLQIVNGGIPTQLLDARKQSFSAVVNSQGIVLASRGAAAPSMNTQIQNALPTPTRTDLITVLQHHSSSPSFGEQMSNGMIVLLAPIQEGNGPVLGALIMKIPSINGMDLFLSYGNLLSLVGINVVLLTILTGGAGTLFGALNARSFTRRFKQLSQAAASWSHGDFSTIVHDPSGDELGQLSRQLNKMAEELQTLLETRQQLAILEERNRLARDLHDSVKQQVFSLAMQIGALKALLRRDTDAAERRLNEIERTVRMAQEELASLIHELRPAVLEGKNLPDALKELAKQWADQTWISAQVSVEGTDTFPPEIEETLFRITQEALSNVARHSNASAVQIRLRCEKESVTLVIDDNGQGFNAAKIQGRGVGLLSMRERIQNVDGDIQVKSTVGKGTEIYMHCSTAPMRKKGV